MVDSYREFLSAATLEEFTIPELSVYAFAEPPAPVHMAHLRFEIAYGLDQQHYREEGLEIYTVTGSGDGLAIVWRAQSVLDTRLL